MKRIFVLLLLLPACATSVPDEGVDVQRIAAQNSCEQLSDKIDAMEAVIENAAPSETTEIVQDTAINAAKTGVQVSGALGSAGAFAGIGINFLHRLYSADAKTRQAEARDIAFARQSILIDAYYEKGCEGSERMDTYQTLSDW